MWLFLNNAALSIVAHRDEPDCLLVRARVAGDIERIFPSAEVHEMLEADYRYRANVRREEVAARIAQSIATIDYDNFKNSCGTARHNAYMEVWESWWHAAQTPGIARR
jgi:hypothetical protein